MNSTRTSFDDLFEAGEKQAIADRQAKQVVESKFSFSTAATLKTKAFSINVQVAQAMISQAIDLSTLPNKRSCK